MPSNICKQKSLLVVFMLNNFASCENSTLFFFFFLLLHCLFSINVLLCSDLVGFCFSLHCKLSLFHVGSLTGQNSTVTRFDVKTQFEVNTDRQTDNRMIDRKLAS